MNYSTTLLVFLSVLFLFFIPTLQQCDVDVTAVQAQLNASTSFAAKLKQALIAVPIVLGVLLMLIIALLVVIVRKVIKLKGMLPGAIGKMSLIAFLRHLDKGLDSLASSDVSVEVKLTSDKKVEVEVDDKKKKKEEEERKKKEKVEIKVEVELDDKKKKKEKDEKKRKKKKRKRNLKEKKLKKKERNFRENPQEQFKLKKK